MQFSGDLANRLHLPSLWSLVIKHPLSQPPRQVLLILSLSSQISPGNYQLSCGGDKCPLNSTLGEQDAQKRRQGLKSYCQDIAGISSVSGEQS